MSEQNVEIVRKLYAHWVLGEWEPEADLGALYDRFLDPNFEFVLSTEAFPDAGVHRGVEAALRAYSRVLEAWDEYAPGPLEKIVDRGDRVVALYRIHGRGKASGAEVEMKVGSIFTFRNGKVVRVVFADRPEALEAAGLRE